MNQINFGALADSIGNGLAPGGALETSLQSRAVSAVPNTSPKLTVATPTLLHALGQIVASLLDPELGKGYGQGLRRGFDTENRRRERQSQLDLQSARTAALQANRQSAQAQSTLRQLTTARQKLATTASQRSRSAQATQLGQQRIQSTAEQKHLDRASREGQRELDRKSREKIASLRGTLAPAPSPTLSKRDHTHVADVLGGVPPQDVQAYEGQFAVRKAALISARKALGDPKGWSGATVLRAQKIAEAERHVNQMQLNALRSRYGPNGPRPQGTAKEKTDRLRWTTLLAERSRLAAAKPVATATPPFHPFDGIVTPLQGPIGRSQR